MHRVVKGFYIGELIEQKRKKYKLDEAREKILKAYKNKEKPENIK